MVTKKKDVKYNKKYTTIIHNNANPTTTWFNVSNFRSTPSSYTNRSPDRQYCSKPDITDIRKQFARSFLHPAHVRAKTLSYRNGKRARPAWRDARPLTLLPTSLYLSFGARRETEKDRGTVAWVIMSLSREPDNVVVETRWSDCTGSRAGRDTFSDSLSLSFSFFFSPPCKKRFSLSVERGSPALFCRESWSTRPSSSSLEGQCTGRAPHYNSGSLLSLPLSIPPRLQCSFVAAAAVARLIPLCAHVRVYIYILPPRVWPRWDTAALCSRSLLQQQRPVSVWILHELSPRIYELSYKGDMRRTGTTRA